MINFAQMVQRYEVNTSVSVEKKTFMEFPAITVCNKNIIHCQHLFDMILDCEYDPDNHCQKWDVYRNLYEISNCKTSPGVAKDGKSVCKGHNASEMVIIPSFDMGKQKSIHLTDWYVLLSTDEMKQLSHQPQDFIVHCVYSYMNITSCSHLKEIGGTKIFSSTKGVCYSFNLKEYLPDDPRNRLTKVYKEQKLLEAILMEHEDGHDAPSMIQFQSGPIQGLELIFNVEGYYYIFLISILRCTAVGQELGRRFENQDVQILLGNTCMQLV